MTTKTIKTEVQSPVEVLLSDELQACTSKSNQIRLCLSKGMTRGDTARLLGIRYQHVRNVELTPLKGKPTA